MTACMGGWCRIRDHCPRYMAPSDCDSTEDQRWCPKGSEGLALSPQEIDFMTSSRQRANKEEIRIALHAART